jgi:tRNA dimethylallyltransferase
VPFSAIGYREAFAVLAEDLSIEQAIEQTAQRTRAYARRQRTWFRREAGITWLPGSDRRSVRKALGAAAAFLDRAA